MMKTRQVQVLFLAMGYPYVVMAINAARSVRQSGTQANIKLITNLPIRRIRYHDTDIFDEICVVDCDTELNRWIKARIIDYADGEHNIFLDCDVEVLFSLNEIASLLDNFDIAARNLPFETRKKFKLENGLDIQQMSLSEINTGVIFFSQNTGARKMFDLWHKNFLDMGQFRDQPAFLKALIDGRNTRFFALPPMWNATPFPAVDRRQMKRTPNAIRILHYRDPIFWPSVAKHLAEVHEFAKIELKFPSTDFDAQSVAYGHLARQYKSAFFPTAIGRAFLRLRLMCLTGNFDASLRVVGKAKSPHASEDSFE